MKKNRITQVLKSTIIACLVAGSIGNSKGQSISGDITPCPNQYSTYTASFSQTSCTITGYNWSLPKGATMSSASSATSSSIDIEFANCSNLNIMCYISVECTNPDGSKTDATYPAALNVVTPCYVAPTVTVNPTYIPCGTAGTVTVSANQQAAAGTYYWTLPGGLSTSAFAGSSGTTTNGTITVYVSAGYTGGNILVYEVITSACHYITPSTAVSIKRVPPAPAFSSSNQLSFCGPNTYGKAETYSITPVAGASSYTYTLSGTGASFSSTGSVTTLTTSSTSVSVYFSAAGSYQLCVNSNSPCGNSSSACETIVVYPAIPGTPTLTGSASPAACPAFQWKLVANATNASSYIWSNSDNVDFSLGATTTPTGANALYINSYSKTTLVTVTASNNCGPSPASTKTSFYSSSQTICSKYTQRASGADTASAVGSADLSDFKLYPNPASTSLTIQYILPDNSSFATVSVYDLLGNKVMEWNLSPENNSVTENISTLPNAMYVYIISSSNNILSRGKVLVQH